MKKIILIVMAAALLFTAGCTKKESAPQIATTDMEETALNLVNDMIKKDYDSAYNNYSYSDKLLEAISVEFFETNIGGSFEKLGDFVEMKTPFASQQDEYIIISVPLVFSKSSINYNVVFDENGDIAGINMGKYKEGDSQEKAESENAEASVIELAQNYAKDLMDGNYEKAYSEYPHDKTMQDAVNSDEYKKIIEDLMQNTGEFKSFGKPYSFETGGYTAVDIPIIMEKENVNIEIYFDAQSNIAGLKFVAYQEKSTDAKLPDGTSEQELDSEVNGYTLGGTLTLPAGEGPFPIVILVHGSGPTDRDETILTNKPFRDIAWGLAQRGIATYRYDKRTYTYGEDFQTDYDFTIYDETIDDAVEIAKLMSEIENIDSKNVFILGHSLGGYALPRIAENSPFAAGYIMMAGSVRAPHELIPEQYEYLFNLDGTVSEQEKATLDKVHSDVNKIENIDDYDETEIFMGTYKAYIQDLLAYNPVEKAKSITQPMLVLQGERDYQVTMTEYNMWHDAFGDSANWTFNLYPKLNHLMMAGEGAPSNADYSKTGTVDEKVIADIAEFVLK